MNWPAQRFDKKESYSFPIERKSPKLSACPLLPTSSRKVGRWCAVTFYIARFTSLPFIKVPSESRLFPTRILLISIFTMAKAHLAPQMMYKVHRDVEAAIMLGSKKCFTKIYSPVVIPQVYVDKVSTVVF